MIHWDALIEKALDKAITVFVTALVSFGVGYMINCMKVEKLEKDKANLEWGVDYFMNNTK